MKRPIFAVLMILSLLVAGCSAPVPLPDPPTPTGVSTITPQAEQTLAPTAALPTPEATSTTAAPTAEPTSAPTATLEPTATTVPTPAATPWGESHTVEAGGFRFQVPSSYRVSISGSTASITNSSDDLTINVSTGDQSSGTTGETALARLVNVLGPTLDAIEAGPSYTITIDGKEGLAADIVGLQEGEPFAGQIVVVEVSSGRWFSGSALQTTNSEGARWSASARDAFAAFLRSVQFF